MTRRRRLTHLKHPHQEEPISDAYRPWWGTLTARRTFQLPSYTQHNILSLFNIVDSSGVEKNISRYLQNSQFSSSFWASCSNWWFAEKFTHLLEMKKNPRCRETPLMLPWGDKSKPAGLTAINSTQEILFSICWPKLLFDDLSHFHWHLCFSVLARPLLSFLSRSRKVRVRIHSRFLPLNNDFFSVVCFASVPALSGSNWL